MSKKYNAQKIRKHKTYTISELAKVFSVSKSSIKRHCRLGLEPIDRNSVPWLLYGNDIIEYFEVVRQKKKIRIKPGQVLCSGCRVGVRLRTDSISLEYSGRKLGIGKYRQIYIRGIGEFCEHRCLGFSSERIIDEFLKYYPELKREADSSRQPKNYLKLSSTVPADR